MKKYAIALLLLASCARRDGVFEIPVAHNDIPANKEFSLEYTNTSHSAVCIGSGNWPSQAGMLDNSGDRVYVVIDDKRHYMNKQSDYCEKCTSRVEKGMSVRSRLLYSSFNINEDDVAKAKKLVFSAFAENCHK